MAYFSNDPTSLPEEEYQPVFRQPVEDDEDDLEGEGEEFYGYEDDYLDEQERLEARQMRWKLLAGAGDFLGVLAGTVVILVLIALLISLITWVQADISQSFTLWQTKI